MNRKEEFKAFARLHPELVSFVRSGEMSWQKFYEIYDIYGEDENAWKSYFNNKNESSSSFESITEKFKNIDMNSIQEHIKTAQKALNLVQELTNKGTESVTDLVKTPITPRPLNKFFED